MAYKLSDQVVRLMESDKKIRQMVELKVAIEIKRDHRTVQGYFKNDNIVLHTPEIVDIISEETGVPKTKVLTKV